MPVERQLLSETPVTILDFETTGLSPKLGSRVIEVAAVRVEPSGPPELILDTLIDPEGPVYASEIHGIYDEDVVGAPCFHELGGEIAYALRGGPVAAFNAAFDISFLSAEYTRYAGAVYSEPPYVCLMYLRPLLGLGKRCSLSAACDDVGIAAPSHRAADDALAAAHLWTAYRDSALRAGVRTFGDLKAAGKYKFLSSFGNQVLSEPLTAYGRRPCGTAPKPRWDALQFEAPAALRTLEAQISGVAATPARQPSATARRRQYWRALQDALSDGVIDGEELRALHDQQRRLALATEDLYAVHARVAAERLTLCAEDHKISESEAAILKDLFWVLRELGWAPGDASQTLAQAV